MNLSHPGLTRRAVLSTAASYAPLRAQIAEPAYVEARTAAGRVRGTKTPVLCVFRGIPYAGSVSGTNRFKAAPPVKPWTGVRDALQFGSPSWQAGELREEPPQAEDCLFLNIWTPACDGRRRPVMFYSHGGGFTAGSAAAGYQDASGLARTFEVVVVSTNHRLGIMGYLFLGDLGGEEYSTSGNQGLLDICEGLKWVRENIEGFGGDPGNVMLFGESGGGAKTSCLYAMPAAAPLFHKASIESGPGVRMMPREAAAETTLMTLKELGIDKKDWHKLLGLPPEKLLSIHNALTKTRGRTAPRTRGRNGIGDERPGTFGPVVDGAILPRHPFDPDAPLVSKNKPLIVGWNRDETLFELQRDKEVFLLTDISLKERLSREFGTNADAVFEAYRKSRPTASPTDLYIAVTTAQSFALGSVTIAERKAAQNGAPAYLYIFTHESRNIIPGTRHKRGASHAIEIPYKFYNVQPPRMMADGRPTTWVSSPEDRRTAHNMAEFWSTFARTGRPAAKGQPDWRAYSMDKRSTMEIDTECRVVDDPNPLERQLWERLEV